MKRLHLHVRTALMAGAMGLVPCVAVVAAPVLSQAHAAAPTGNMPLHLTAVTVNGNQQVSTDAITSALPFHVGDTVTRNQINAGMQKVVDLYSQKNVGASFKTRLKFVNKTVGIELDIAEQAPAAAAAPASLVLDKLVFVGNKKISTEDLAAATKLAPGQAVSNENVAVATQNLAALYKSRNLNAQIQPAASYPNHDNHVILTYQITEVKAPKSDDRGDL